MHVEMHAVSVVAVRERTIVKPQVLTDSVLQRLNSQSVLTHCAISLESR